MANTTADAMAPTPGRNVTVLIHHADDDEAAAMLEIIAVKAVQANVQPHLRVTVRPDADLAWSLAHTRSVGLEASTVGLFDHLAAVGRIGTVRFVAVASVDARSVALQMDHAVESITQKAARLVASTSLRRHARVAVVGAGDPMVDERFFSPLADVNLVVAPFDRLNDGATAREVRRSEGARFWAHGAVEVASVCGMWEGMTVAPIDTIDRAASTSQTPRVRFTQSRVRFLETPSLQLADLLGENRDVPVPDGYQPLADGRDELTAVAREMVARDLSFEEAEPPQGRVELTGRQLLLILAREFWFSALEMPGLVLRSAAGEVSTIVGRALQTAVGRHGHRPSDGGAGGHTSAELTHDLDKRVDQLLLQRRGHSVFEPVTGATWTRLVRTVFGLIDGDPDLKSVRMAHFGDPRRLAASRSALIDGIAELPGVLGPMALGRDPREVYLDQIRLVDPDDGERLPGPSRPLASSGAGPDIHERSDRAPRDEPPVSPDRPDPGQWDRLRDEWDEVLDHVDAAGHLEGVAWLEVRPHALASGRLTVAIDQPSNASGPGDDVLDELRGSFVEVLRTKEYLDLDDVEVISSRVLARSRPMIRLDIPAPRVNVSDEGRHVKSPEFGAQIGGDASHPPASPEPDCVRGTVGVPVAPTRPSPDGPAGEADANDHDHANVDAPSYFHPSDRPGLLASIRRQLQAQADRATAAGDRYAEEIRARSSLNEREVRVSPAVPISAAIGVAIVLFLLGTSSMGVRGTEWLIDSPMRQDVAIVVPTLVFIAVALGLTDIGRSLGGQARVILLAAGSVTVSALVLIFHNDLQFLVGGAIAEAGRFLTFMLSLLCGTLILAYFQSQRSQGNLRIRALRALVVAVMLHLLFVFIVSMNRPFSPFRLLPEGFRVRLTVILSVLAITLLTVALAVLAVIRFREARKLDRADDYWEWALEQLERAVDAEARLDAARRQWEVHAAALAQVIREPFGPIGRMDSPPSIEPLDVLKGGWARLHLNRHGRADLTVRTKRLLVTPGWLRQCYEARIDAFQFFLATRYGSSKSDMLERRPEEDVTVPTADSLRQGTATDDRFEFTAKGARGEFDQILAALLERDELIDLFSPMLNDPHVQQLDGFDRVKTVSEYFAQVVPEQHAMIAGDATALALAAHDSRRKMSTLLWWPAVLGQPHIPDDVDVDVESTSLIRHGPDVVRLAAVRIDVSEEFDYHDLANAASGVTDTAAEVATSYDSDLGL